MDSDTMRGKLTLVIDMLRGVQRAMDDSTYPCECCGIERRVHPIEWAAKQSLEGAETRVMKVLEKLESGEWRDRDPLVSPASKRRE